ncbi:MAG: hypothetical protein QM731_04110 [Chitinophagaceae bacterium]
MPKFILPAVLLLFSIYAHAQRFSGHAPSTSWKQVNTDTVRVVFPEGYEQQASMIAATAHRLGLQTQSTMGSRFRKVSIVLQPNTTVANGYVGLGPWRSEFMLTPSPSSFNLGSLPWSYTLALHEYRHVQQYSNFRKGISAVAYYLFGEQGQELFNSATVPNWFWEGDAVYQETRMSDQGRGRLPYFFKDYRSLWTGRKQYSWMKLRSGSLQDFIPNHYPLGYMLVSYGREKYGEDLWRKVTGDAVSKVQLYPLQRAIKKYTGKNYQDFRKEAIAYYQGFLPADAVQDSVALWAQEHKHFVADEGFPQWLDANTIVFVSEGYDRIPAFYIRNLQTGRQHKVRVKDISQDNYFSCVNGKIVYAAYEPALRWSWTDYSVLKVLDAHTGKQRSLTSHSKYFSPDISADGKQVVAVDVQPGGASSLHIIDAGNGEVLGKIPNAQKLFYTFPKFYNDSTIVSAVRNITGQMTMALINIHNGNVDELLPYSMKVIGFPSVYKDTITFTAANGETDEIFAITGSRQLLQYTGARKLNASTGNYQASIRNNKAVWTAFTSVGYHIVHQPVQSNSWQPLPINHFTDTSFNYRLNGLRIAKTDPDTGRQYPVTAYSKAFHLFNLHSRRPFVDDPEYTFSVVGENVLNTMLTELYFTYNRDDRSKQFGGTVTYGGLFPYIHLGTSYTLDRSALLRQKTVFWNEWQGKVGVQLPFNFTSGKRYRSLNVIGDLVYNKRYFQGTYKDSFDNRGFAYFTGLISYTTQSQSAVKHIYPRWAQSASLRYSKAVTALDANQVTANAYAYFPGLFRTHNLIINGSVQQRDTLNNARFSNALPFSRGYIAQNYHQMGKFGVNYHLPLAYPDWGFGNIVYFLRMRANLFYDDTYVADYTAARHKTSLKFRSYGTEVYFDTKWWNEYDVTFGVRYSRLIDGNRQGLGANQWEFIVPITALSR